ncbi:glutamate racemase [Pseudochelatococcus contaminans]|uniref:Glutamate racemase n=1 Tax=Pseudochelatococcus contaminans TaxID=1538103 RepID=A0A7W5Z1T8_9HYPH|nr:glutamate racemase [Pseudochelatococcus contaminans]MBB3808481.1 glutamate racemase [Pseudochelatococcus contaminans]
MIADPSVASGVPRVLVFDSGVGGLTVYAELRKARPDADFIYVADDAGFPYGGMPADRLLARVVALMGDLIARLSPDIVVIACNTASTLVLPALREHSTIPFVGTVPAIKPAAEQTASGEVTVLATPGTVARVYTHELIRKFADSCRVNLVGSTRLAGFAEQELAGQPVDDAVLRDEMAPVFIEREARRTDMVVLACTHYPLLLQRFDALAPWPVAWIDPAPAIARRMLHFIGDAPQGVEAAGPAKAIFTSGAAPSGPLASALLERGLVVEDSKKWASDVTGV